MSDEKIALQIVVGGKNQKTSSGGGLLGAIPSLTGLVIGVNAMNDILKEVLWAFKPLISMISQILKLVGSFLQPVAEMLMLLLRPVLEILRPLLVMFRVMMAPFMDLIRRLSAVSTVAAAQGDLTTTAQISALMVKIFTAGFTMSSASVLSEVGTSVAKWLADGVANITNQSSPVTNVIKGMFDVGNMAVQNGLGIMTMKMVNNMDITVTSIEDNIKPKLQSGIVDPFTRSIDKMIEKVAELNKKTSSSSSSKSKISNHHYVLSSSGTTTTNTSNMSVSPYTSPITSIRDLIPTYGILALGG